MFRKLVLFVFVMMLCSCTSESQYDICVYGGTSSAVITSYAAAQQGLKVVMVSPDIQVGGMSSGGLGYTDIGNKQVVTGLARQFYRKIGEHYGKLEQWIFEPSVAEDIFEEYLKHPNITVLRQYRLLGVDKNGTRIRAIKIYSDSDTLSVEAPYWVDATYEGDLMAKSGVSYTVGREPNSQYNEIYNGVQMLHGHQFPDGVDPFKKKGDPKSGLLWGISDAPLYDTGSGDTLEQAYNFRICLTDSLENMIPITRPDNYDPSRYELLLRLFDAQKNKRELNHYFIWSKMPNRKTDINNRGGFSTDMIGMNYNYPEADYSEREKIFQEHVDYTKGLLYFYGHDPRVPQELRDEMLRWGYPKDEYLKSNHWTPQLYVREARRMLGEYVATQHDCEGKTQIYDGVGSAAYNMDSHNCQRVVIHKDGKWMVKNEGNVEINGGIPYPISYRSLTPRRTECTNLLVPVCLSASHIAYGSIRMEPVFMVLGQSSAVAIKIALKDGKDIQDVDVKEIQKSLEENPYLDTAPADILIDDVASCVTYSSGWRSVKGRMGYGPTYLECREGENESLQYALPTTLEGEYELYSYQQMGKGVNPITKFKLQIGSQVYHSVFNREDYVLMGQTSGDWFLLGSYTFKKNEEAYLDVIINNSKSPSRADAILLIKK